MDLTLSKSPPCLPVAFLARVPTGVILAHMRPADQTAWYPFALKLAATGKFTVLTFDFRGFGDSGGEKDFDLLDADLAAAYAYMTDDLKIAEDLLWSERVWAGRPHS